MHSIGQALNQVMKEEGLSQIAFATLLGVGRVTIYKYFTGRIFPSHNMLKRISTILNRRLILTYNAGSVTARFDTREGTREVTFDIKMEQCRPAVMRYCMVQLHMSKEDAEDATQETMLRGMLLHYTWRPDVAMTTWLIGIAKRLNDTRKKRIVYVEEYINDIQDEDVTELLRENTHLFEYVQALSKRDREYFKLYVNGISYKDIAAQLGTTEAYIKVRIRLIKQQIRRNMQKTNCA